MDRPDLTAVDPKIRGYIEHLESLVKAQPPTGENRIH